MMEIKQRVFAITGGGQGLGRAMAVDLASSGACLALIDRNVDSLEASARLCREAGGEARIYVGDVTDEPVVEALFQGIHTDFGELNGLINNAGLMRDALLIKVKEGQLLDKMSLQQWQSVIDVNLTGTFLCGREAAGLMATQQKSRTEGGVIINISSVSRTGNRGQSNYSASKSAVATLVVVWARELARYGIRVGGIAPGVIATEMTAQMNPDAMDRIVQSVPLNRLGLQQELAHSARYIIENDYFTGRLIEMDGGLRV